MNSSTALRLIAIASTVLVAGLAAAQESRAGLTPGGFFVEGGAGGNRTWAATGGLSWPWAWRRGFAGGDLGGATEAYVSEWSAPNVGGRRSFIQLGLVPVFRFRFEQGRSPLFAEAGIGLSVTDRLFTTDEKKFTTRFNFVDILGLGLSLGEDRKQELGLRLSHLSNAGIKRPNPGQNFLQLRYARMF